MEVENSSSQANDKPKADASDLNPPDEHVEIDLSSQAEGTIAGEVTIAEPPRAFGGGGGGPELTDPERRRAHGAFIIAILIVGTFAAVILLTLLITLGVLWKSGDPTRVKLFAEGVTPIYESLGKFLPPVFGSLLAFILGYYYSKEQK
jgi:hypothetical protein